MVDVVNLTYADGIDADGREVVGDELELIVIQRNRDDAIVVSGNVVPFVIIFDCFTLVVNEGIAVLIGVGSVAQTDGQVELGGLFALVDVEGYFSGSIISQRICRNNVRDGNLLCGGSAVQVGLQVAMLRHFHIVLSVCRSPVRQQLEVVGLIFGDITEGGVLDVLRCTCLVLDAELYLCQHTDDDEVFLCFCGSDGLHIAHGDALFAVAVISSIGVEAITIDGSCLGGSVGLGYSAGDGQFRWCCLYGGNGACCQA